MTARKVESLARLICTHYEQAQARERGFYTPVRWENLPTASRQEHLGIARAALAGTTYNGQHLPQWVLDLTPPKGTP